MNSPQYGRLRWIKRYRTDDPMQYVNVLQQELLSPTGITHWIDVPLEQEEPPPQTVVPFKSGDRVVTALGPKGPQDWSKPGVRRFNAPAVVVAASSSHGACCRVEYTDGERGWFNHEELTKAP